MIRIRKWERFQHYKDRNPPWIRVYRDLVEECEEWFELSDSAARLLVELWLLASRTLEGTIDRDANGLTWKLRKQDASATLASLQELVRYGFIEIIEEDASTTLAERLQDAIPETETETETEVDTGSDEPGQKPVVENWGDFAGWYRTTGRELLWQAPDPPDWAPDGWNVARDLSICKALVNKGEKLATLKAVIERNKDPTCMLRYNQAGRWDYWERAKADLFRADEIKGMGVHVEIKGAA